jgi:polysaccharide biosynthesis/export protein
MRTTMTKILSGSCLFVALVALGPNYASGQQGEPRDAAVVTAAGTEGIQSRLPIGPGDLLNVTVFDVPELAQTLRVSDTGDATFQLIGSLHLSGLTTDEARILVAHKLKEGNFIVDPQVSVLISEYSTQGVSVLGQVQKPGVYPVLGSRSLLDIISEAGGTTSTAGPDVTVKHLDGSTATVKLTKNAQASLATDFEVLPGDKVIIPRAGLVYVIGDVGRPGGFLMENDGKMSILQAVAMAGGTNRTASMNHSRLIRKTATGYAEISVPLKTLLQGNGGDMQLESEDILYVPTNAMKSALYRTTPAVVAAASSAAIYRGIP